MESTYYEIDEVYQDLQNAKIYWDIGKGLQKVNELITSNKLDELIINHISGT